MSKYSLIPVRYQALRPLIIPPNPECGCWQVSVVTLLLQNTQGREENGEVEKISKWTQAANTSLGKHLSQESI